MVETGRFGLPAEFLKLGFKTCDLSKGFLGGTQCFGKHSFGALGRFSGLFGFLPGQLEFAFGMAGLGFGGFGGPGGFLRAAFE